MENENTPEIIEMRSDDLTALIAETRKLKELAKSDAEALKKLKLENDNFRLMMVCNIGKLGGPRVEVPSRIAFYQSRAAWSEMPIETLLTFLELYQLQTEIFSELIHEKAGKAAIKTHVQKIAAAKAGEVAQIRENILSREQQIKEKTNKKASTEKVLYSSDPNTDKAIKSIMKALGVTSEIAAAMVASAKPKTT